MTATLVTKQKPSLPPPKPSDVANALGISTLSIEWLAGDGSDRCYYRLESPELDQSLVLMQLSGSDAEALRKNGYDWIKIAETLTLHDISVPKVIIQMPNHAALVIEDYGDFMLEGEVSELKERNEINSIYELYAKAAKIASKLLSIQPSKNDVWCSRSFDSERFRWELDFFLQKYAFSVAGIRLSASEKKTFDFEVQKISEFLAYHSRYFVHRDYHSRNIMVKDQQLAIIDFQDARIGPAAYDIVSLCFDSYVPLTSQQRLEILNQSIKSFRQSNSSSVVDEIQASWKAVLLQRQLKAIGSFGFLTNDKKRGDYLRYVRPALATLEQQDIFDARWPFLAQEIPRRIRNFIGLADL